ncbi:hypothetical protein [Xanthovirga aplysinae]|uniref:hypothetical protein n=1 Tax=Xanthovirga aplysinae TaxID=2529853 RepID=UPI0012BCECE7|nr:hypothetical protein [Xanthovirga aplysinae]MTI33346.1 hypothetical protein [Xanthovirga aplysinae]
MPELEERPKKKELDEVTETKEELLKENNRIGSLNDQQIEKKTFFKKVIADPQNIIAIAVTIISVCALFVSVFQARVMQNQVSLMREQGQVMRTQAKASLWPYLHIEVNRSEEMAGVSKYEVVVSNQGTGPAIVEGVRLHFENYLIKDWGQLFDFIDPDSLFIGTVSKSNLNGKVLRAGEELRFIGLNGNPVVANPIIKNIDKVHLEVCYRSVFDEFWSIKRRGLKGNLVGNGGDIITYEPLSENPIKDEEQFLE